jgi:uncharacterized protein (DUF2384 family)
MAIDPTVEADLDLAPGDLGAVDRLGQADHLVALHARLGEVFASYAAARDWLRAPSDHLDGQCPADAIRAGHVDRAAEALGALDAGAPR